MDDADTYGPEFYRMGFGDAVEASHLTDYKVLVIAVAEGSTLPRYENLDVETGAGPNAITLKEAVKFAGCWDALADPTTRTADGRMTGLAHPALAAKRAIAFTNTIRASLRVQRYWNPIIDAVTPRRGARRRVAWRARFATSTATRTPSTALTPLPGCRTVRTVPTVG